MTGTAGAGPATRGRPVGDRGLPSSGGCSRGSKPATASSRDETRRVAAKGSSSSGRQEAREREQQRQVRIRERQAELLARRQRLLRQSRGGGVEAEEGQKRRGLEAKALELERVVERFAKERLQLERHLQIVSQGLQRYAGVDVTRLSALEDSARRLEVARRALDSEKEQLDRRLRAKSDLCHDLEHQLVRVIEKNTQLALKNTDLEKQVQELQNVSEEDVTRSLVCPSAWSSAQPVARKKRSDVGTLHEKVDNLESILKQMREAAEKRKELERQHAEALSQLRERQHEIQKYTKVSDADKPRQYETIEALQSKIRELEKKTELQNVRHEELLLEMASIKRSQMAAASGAASSASCSTPSSSPTMGKSTALVPHATTTTASTSGSSPWKPLPRSVSTNQEVQTSPESGNSTPDSSRPLSNDSTARSTPTGSVVVFGTPLAGRPLGSEATMAPASGAGGEAWASAFAGYGLSSPYGTTNYPHIPSRLLPGPHLPSHKHQETPSQIHRPQPQLPRPGRQIPQHPGPRSSVYQDDRFPSESRHSMLTRHQRARGGDAPRPLSSAPFPTFPTIPPHRAHTHRGGGAAMLSWRSASVSDMRRSLHHADPQQLLYGGSALRTSHGSPYSLSSFAAPASQALGAVAPTATHRGLSPHATAMGPAGSTLDSTSAEIDRIMAKIEQDNKILAELDKSRSTIGFSSAGDSPGRAGQITSDSGFLSSSSLPGRSLSPMPMSATQATSGSSLPMLLPQVPSSSLMGSTAATSSILGGGGMLGLSSGMGALSGLGQPSSALSTMMGSLQQRDQMAAVASAAGLGHPLSGIMGSAHLPSTTHHGVHFGGVSHGTSPGRLMPQIPAGKKSFLNGGLSGALSTFPTPLNDHLVPENKVVDMLDIPGKGRCYVYIARYSYDPLQHSPNENPEAELAVNAGDYLLVWGNMDEDGFFDGELLDGRRGLVPSNFVQKLVGEDLLEFHQSVVMGGLRDAVDDSVSTTIPQDLEACGTADEAQNMMIVIFPQGTGATQLGHTKPMSAQANLRQQPSKAALMPQSKVNVSKRVLPMVTQNKEALGKRIAEHNYIDLEDIMEEDEEGLSEQIGEGPDLFFSVLVPAPKQLTLERQLNKSILIGWNPPDCPPGTIESYHVYVDGVLKTTVKATERTRALVEGVDSTRPHRISVRSITPNRRTSRDAACTMMIGKDIPLAPSCVKATNVTSTSAVISWMPCNSNYQHVVCVNNVEVRTVKAGVYRHTITGLAPNTTYRVTVRAKNIRAPYFDEKSSQHVERLSSHIDFRTLPKGCKGLPDPPVDIQVEAGPQDGTLLVTWLPVTFGASGIPGTSNGAPVTGYAVYADGKKVTDVDSPTGDHALIDINKLVGLNPKQVTVRTKSKDSQSSDSVPTPIPNHVLKGKMLKLPDEDDSASELSDIAEEPEEEVLEETSEQMKAERRMMKEERAMMQQQQQQMQQQQQQMQQQQQQQQGQQMQYGGPQRQYGPPPPGSAVPPHMRPHGARGGMMGRGGMRVDAHGQVVIETDENLSDKEIYPGAHGNIPSIVNKGFQHSEITKDSASEGNFSEDDYDAARRGAPGMRGVHYNERMPRSHMDARQGPPRPQQGMAGPQGPRDMHDPYYDQRHQRHHHAPDGRERGGPATGAFRGGGPPPGADYGGVGRGRGAVGPGQPLPPGQQGPQQHYGPSGGPQPPPGGTREGGKRVRWFAALFDYDPTTMSPNPDACEEELPFSEGDSIKVYGEKDADGFYWGECRGRRGYVPYNMVVEVQENAEAGHGARGQAHGRGDRWGDTYANMPVKKMVALYDYDPQELSPNVDAEVELSFKTGNTIYVYGEMDDDGFYMGELDGVRGLVPSNFLTEAPGPQGGPGGAGGVGQPDYNESRRREGRGGEMGGNYDRTRSRGHGPGARGPPPPPRDGMRMVDPRDRRKDACLPTHIDSRADRQDPRGRGDPRVAVDSRRGGRGGGGWPQGGAAGRGGPQGGEWSEGGAWGDGDQQTGPYGAQQQQPMGGPQQQQGPPQQQPYQQGPPQQQQQQGGPFQQQQGGPFQQQQGGPFQQQQGGPFQQQQGGPFQQQGGPFQQQGGPQGPQQQMMGDGQMGRKPIKGIPAVVPDFAIPGGSKEQAGATAQTSSGPSFPSAPNFMQKLTEVTGVGGGGTTAPGEGAMDNLLSKGKELIFKKFGLGD
ncbi:uncharacterized protein LOC124155432 isoform X2 [Ischnura elegans]|uniref:uncharacterized protein LOC124155432 isoform X2 n=1 Tax=Ischnura elegans TaxID=197161 RepID=UPI001ED8AE84|nr:uncharacterized protein LOC124155432 isoform X2 [Ischnura elegans]